MLLRLSPAIKVLLWALSRPSAIAQASSRKRWITLAAVLGVIVLASGVLACHPGPHRQSTRARASTSQPPAAAPSTSVPASSAAPAPPAPVTAPTSATPAPTQVITAVAVVNGQPANGYVEVPSIPSASNVTDVFGCDASAAAVAAGIYHCAPNAAGADVCWPSTAGTLLCLDNPWDKELRRVTDTDPLPAAVPPATPEPFALLLDDGTQCRLRNGGAWGGRDDGYYGAYSCNGQNRTVLASAQSGPTAEDRSHPLWTVKVGPIDNGSGTHFPPPETHTVTTAWFAGN